MADGDWGTCVFCGWTLTVEGVRDNGGIPYCCATQETLWKDKR